MVGRLHPARQLRGAFLILITGIAAWMLPACGSEEALSDEDEELVLDLLHEYERSDPLALLNETSRKIFENREGVWAFDPTLPPPEPTSQLQEEASCQDDPPPDGVARCVTTWTTPGVEGAYQAGSQRNVYTVLDFSDGCVTARLRKVEPETGSPLRAETEGVSAEESPSEFEFKQCAEPAASEAVSSTPPEPSVASDSEVVPNDQLGPVALGARTDHVEAALGQPRETDFGLEFNVPGGLISVTTDEGGEVVNSIATDSSEFSYRGATTTMSFDEARALLPDWEATECDNGAAELVLAAQDGPELTTLQFFADPAVGSSDGRGRLFMISDETRWQSLCEGD